MPTVSDIVLMCVAALLIGLFVGVVLPIGPAQVQAPVVTVTDPAKLVSL